MGSFRNWMRRRSPKGPKIEKIKILKFSSKIRVHRGRSDTAANANANSDAPREFTSEFNHQISKKKLRIQRCEGIR